MEAELQSSIPAGESDSFAELTDFVISDSWTMRLSSEVLRALSQTG